MGIVIVEIIGSWSKPWCFRLYTVLVRESHHLDLDYIGNADACHHTEGEGLDELFQRTKSSIFTAIDGGQLVGLEVHFPH